MVIKNGLLIIMYKNCRVCIYKKSLIKKCSLPFDYTILIKYIRQVQSIFIF